jgi:hypothetical protein
MIIDLFLDPADARIADRYTVRKLAGLLQPVDLASAQQHAMVP